jgi:thiol-disulfide isomerase/thioredoxin
MTTLIRHLTFWAPRALRWALPLIPFWALLATAQSASLTNSTLKVGDLFPDLGKYELEGELPGSLAGKVVVVDFWASWCRPCQRTFPLMEELHHRYEKRGLLILAVNEDRSRAAMEEFLKEYRVTFGVLRDAKRKLAAAINVPSLPTSYLIDGQGRVQSIQPGARTVANSKDFIRQIETLLEQNHKPQ